MDENNNILDFEVTDYSFERLLSEDIALLKLRVCSTGMNKHSMPFTLVTMEKAAESSLRGKPILGKVQFDGDLGGHDKPENSNPIGYIIENQEFQYIPVEDNRIGLFCYAALWKNYAPYEYETFLNEPQNIKGLSMEIRVNETEYGWEDDEEVTQITDFSFRGVAILGNSRVPASENASATMIKFSDMVAETEVIFSTNGISVIDEKDKGETNVDMAEKERIEIDNSAESAIESRTWSSPGSSLWKPLLEASNAQSLVNEAYLRVGDRFREAPSVELSFPHHSLKTIDGKKTLILNRRGLIAAFQRASQMNIVQGKVRSHLLRHYHELGLSTENFELDLQNYTNKYEQNQNKDKDNKKEEITLDYEAKYNDLKKEYDSLVTENETAVKTYESEISKHETEISMLKQTIEEKETSIQEYEQKIESHKPILEEYEVLKAEKFERDKADALSKVEAVFAMVKDTLSKEQTDELRAKVADVTPENCDTFCDKIKSMAFECLALNAKKKEEETTKTFGITNFSVNSGETIKEHWDSLFKENEENKGGK